MLHGTQGRVLELASWKAYDGQHHRGNIQSAVWDSEIHAIEVGFRQQRLPSAVWPLSLESFMQGKAESHQLGLLLEGIYKERIHADAALAVRARRTHADTLPRPLRDKASQEVGLLTSGGRSSHACLFHACPCRVQGSPFTVSSARQTV
jgi:hypothetical protein